MKQPPWIEGKVWAGTMLCVLIHKSQKGEVVLERHPATAHFHIITQDVFIRQRGLNATQSRSCFDQHGRHDRAAETRRRSRRGRLGSANLPAVQSQFAGLVSFCCTYCPIILSHSPTHAIFIWLCSCLPPLYCSRETMLPLACEYRRFVLANAFTRSVTSIE